MLKARDIMSTNVVSVKRDTPILEAIQLMVEQNISGLPVVEDNMILAGILSEKDVVDLFYESENAKNKTVNNYMTEPAFSFEGNTDIEKICDFLHKNIFRRVPITSDRKLIGIISLTDVLFSILQRERNKEETTN